MPPQETLKNSKVGLAQSLVGSLGPGARDVLFEPSEHLWQVWGLILNAILPLLPSCWGFSFALGCGVSPHSHSSAYRLTGVSLTLDMGYHLSATGHSSAAQPLLATGMLGP